MQEEIEHKTVNLAISTTKLSARTLLRGMQFLLRQYDKHASQGKQSMKRLVRQNRGVTNVEIQKTGMLYIFGCGIYTAYRQTWNQFFILLVAEFICFILFFGATAITEGIGRFSEWLAEL
mgnify:CR=1 FL=1